MENATGVARSQRGLRTQQSGDREIGIVFNPTNAAVVALTIRCRQDVLPLQTRLMN
ncbi:hypothetical protein CKA32_002793 [Geitlerinema sp. FC II]|nr:hypothetical protein CKA32_002793 [Geitlerinema sp. FC II]